MPNLVTYIPSTAEQLSRLQAEHAKTLRALEEDSPFYTIVKVFFSARDWIGATCKYLPGSHISINITAQPEAPFDFYQAPIGELSELLEERGYRDGPPSLQLGGYSREVCWVWSKYASLKPAPSLIVTLDLPEKMAGLSMDVRTRTTTETSSEYIITVERDNADSIDDTKAKQQEAYNGFF